MHFSQIKRPSASRYVHVFQDDGMEVLSLDVSTSIDVVYFGNTLTIVPSTPFSATRMYYVMADSGVCTHVSERISWIEFNYFLDNFGDCLL